MKNNLTATFIVFMLLTLISCRSNKSVETNIDNNTHITDFELIHDNQLNNTKIIINSPRAILDSSSQNIQIINNKMQIIDKSNKSIKIKSGKAALNNTTKIISATDNVVISDIQNQGSSIVTSQLNWNLKNSIINLDDEMLIKLPNTIIYSKEGTYDISLDRLDLKNVLFTRTGNNKNELTTYEINVTADKTKWLKKDNSLEFRSEKGQVETTIDLFN